MALASDSKFLIRTLEFLRVGAVPTLVLIVGLFFVYPWLPEPSPAGAALERYSPEQDGGSVLVENFDADGGLVSTESQNLAMVPDLRAFTESRQAIKDELQKIYGSPAEQVAAYAGSLVIPLSVGVIWWLVRRHAGEPITVERLLNLVKKVALPLIAIYMGLQGVEIVVALGVGLAGLLLLALGLGKVEDMTGSLELVTRLIKQDANWQMLLGVVAVVAPLYFARRGRRVLALYLGILGANAFWIQVTNPGMPLSFFGWSGLEPVDFWWVVFFCAVAVFWVVRGRLTEDRARRLLLLVLITLLMRQTGFIEDPFSPVLGFTGIGMIALGLIWDALTIGFWATHDIAQVDFFTGQAALGGFGLFGKPLIYAIFAVTLAESAMDAESDEELAPDSQQAGS